VSLKQRLYPTEEQAQTLIAHCGQRRFVYNLANEGYLTALKLKTSGHPDITFPTYYSQERARTYLWGLSI